MRHPQRFWSVTVGMALIGAIGWWVTGGAAVAAPAWSIKADVAESCSCSPPCPCVFGEEANRKPCEGSRLIEIHKGRVGDVKLDGLSVVVAFRMGEWARYYVSDAASDAQLEAAGQLISLAFPSFESWGVQTTERAEVTIDKSNSTFTFGVPDARVEMKPMTGRDGKAIEVHNLPADFLDGYTQFVSVRNSFEADGESFEHSGTNGFTSRLVAGD